MAWVATQVSNVVAPALHLPSWTTSLVVVLALAGFPVAVVLAWAFEISWDGVRRTPEVWQKAEGPPPEAAEEGRPGQLSMLPAVVLGLVVVASGAAGLAVWEYRIQPARSPGDSARTADATEEYDPSRIGVLYFEDYSRDQDLSYLANGLTEALIHELSQVQALDVVSRNAVKPFREGEVTLDSVVRRLETGTLVEGSVQRSGDSLRVTVQLVDGTEGTHLASRTFQQPWRDLFELQEDLAAEVSRFLRQRLGREISLSRERSEATSVEAWRLVHRARGLRERARELAENEPATTRAARRLLLRADSLLARAEGLDPKWAAPPVERGFLAIQLGRLTSSGTDPLSESRLEDALRAASRALDRVPSSARAHELRGTARFLLWEQTSDAEEAGRLLKRAESDLRKAGDLNPSLASARSTLSELLQDGYGTSGEALVAARRAYEEDAFLTDAKEILKRLCYAQLNLENYRKAADWCGEGRRRYPGFLDFVSLELMALASRGGPEPDPDRAWRLVHAADSLSSPDNPPDYGSMLRMQAAAVLARAGLRDSALAVIRATRRSAPEDPDRSIDYDEAHARLLLGQRDTALDLLSRFLRHNPRYRKTLANDHWFENLRRHPRFEQMLSTAP